MEMDDDEGAEEFAPVVPEGDDPGHDEPEGDDPEDDESDGDADGSTAAVQSNEEEADRAAADLDTVPVTLNFELGKARMTLGDIRTLAPGAIVPFTDGTPASIAIRSGGRLLGRGEVVDVQGQLAIRIVQWGSK
jgi:type III secretion protein Q